MEVVDGSPAESAGIRQEDLILEIDGATVQDASDLQRQMIDTAIGRTIELKVFRNGEIVTVGAVPVELSTR